MPSILELFQSSEKNINPRELDKTPFSDDSTKQIDSNGVYFKNDLYKFGTNYSKIKSDKETFLEQETTGIRFRSAVDINNPLIYGNETIRITQRSTPLLEDMKEGANGGKAGGGLVGGLINKARDFVNSTIGIPETQTPSRLVDKIDIRKANDEPTSKLLQKRLDNFASNNPNQVKDPHSQIPITKDIVGYNGTDVGKFLQQSGGGNPKTIGKQALGSGITFAKDKLRGALFGEGQGVGTAQSSGGLDGKTYLIEYTTNKRTYSDVNKSKKLSPVDDPIQKSLEGTKLDLSLVSPVYGVTRPGSFEFGTPAGQFGKTEYGFKHLGSKDNEGNYTGKGIGFNVNKFSPRLKKSEIPMKDGLSRLDSEIIGLGPKGDKINLLTTADYDSIDTNTGAYIKDGNPIVRDLIPFYIGRVGRGQKKVPFRAILTGITENVSPSWNSQKFLGNPFPFYTYTQVERSTSFNLKIVAYNALELSTNWEKIEQLTKLTYPSIGKSTLVNPPIIDFRLGDIYVNKVGFIETLTYTIPDNGVWEIKDNGYLPKFMEVAITIKFIEDSSVLSALYGFVRSKAAIEKIKEETIPTSTQGVAITGNNSSITPSGDVPNKVSNKVVVTKRGIAPIGDDGIQTTGIPNATPQNKIKSAEPKGIAKTQTPIQAEADVSKQDIVQSAVVDDLKEKSEVSNGGETPLQVVNNPKKISTLQAQAYENLKRGLPPEVKVAAIFNESQLPANLRGGDWSPNSMFAAVKGMVSNRYYTGEMITFYVIHPHGVVDEIGIQTPEANEPTHGFEGQNILGYNRNQIKG